MQGGRCSRHSLCWSQVQQANHVLPLIDRPVLTGGTKVACLGWYATTITPIHHTNPSYQSITPIQYTDNYLRGQCTFPRRVDSSTLEAVILTGSPLLYHPSVCKASITTMNVTTTTHQHISWFSYHYSFPVELLSSSQQRQHFIHRLL